MNEEIKGNPIFANAGILLVDDDPNIIELLSSCCESAGFKHVFAAGDGVTALKILQQQPDVIDLISLDMMMPDMNGLRVAETVANTHHRIVGMVMFTGYGSASDERAFKQLSSNVAVAGKYLLKPTSFEKLAAEYADALRDVYLKREKQMGIQVSDQLKEIQTLLKSNTLDLLEIKQAIKQASHEIEIVKAQANKASSKTEYEFSYVWALAVVFIVISVGLAWGANQFHIPILSLLALASVTILALILIAVFDLSKGGKLSEKSLMEVLRKAFQFISKRK